MSDQLDVLVDAIRDAIVRRRMFSVVHREALQKIDVIRRRASPAGRSTESNWCP